MLRKIPMTILLMVSLLVAASYPFAGTLPTSATEDVKNDGVGSEMLAHYFTENSGQVANDDVRFYGGSDQMQVGFAESAVLLKLVETPPAVARSVEDLDHSSGQEVRGVLLRISFEGSNAVRPQGRVQLPHRSNYFLGSDPLQWRTGVRNFEEVIYSDLYEGIDLVYRWGRGGLKYEFHVRPGADPARIVMVYEGAEDIRIDRDGNLNVGTVLGDVQDSRPYSHQDGGDIDCAFTVVGHLSIGFDCRAWNPSRPLVIDPLVYGTFLGGSGYDAGVWPRTTSVAVDQYGNAYVGLYCESTDFPTTPGAFDDTLDGLTDAVVTKLSADGSALVYATYIGGSSFDVPSSIAVDDSGHVHLVGSTGSDDFPVTPGAYDTTGGLWGDAFVLKLGAAGDALEYSTYLGGDSDDIARSVALGPNGVAYVTGYTVSNDFPVTPDAFDTVWNGSIGHMNYWDGFVAAFDATGSDLLYSTFLGGIWNDYPHHLVADESGNVHVTGLTTSADFPTSPDAWDTTLNGSRDVFVAKLNPDLSDLVYGTFIGGSSWDSGNSIALDSSGNAYVTGYTESYDFPVTPGAFDTTHSLLDDVFVAKLNENGTDLVYSTFIGGSGIFHYGDVADSIAVDSSGRAYVVGTTGSDDFPTTPDALQLNYSGGYSDAFLTVLNAAGSNLTYSTYLGGSEHWDTGESVALDASGGVYVAGSTRSPDFPVTPGAFDTTLNGSDAFLMKLDLGNAEPVVSSFTATQQLEGIAVTFAVEALDPDGDELTYSFDFDSDGIVDISGPNSTASHVWGDDYVGTATVAVSDGELSVNATAQVEVLGAPPEVEANLSCVAGGVFDIFFRIAGEKWHDVTFALREDGNEIFNETVVRAPGNPDEQMARLESFELNGSRSYSATAFYTPEDDPVNGQFWGATPAWIILAWGEEMRLNHTFNARHPDTWFWRVEDLGAYVPERQCLLSANITDAGSDDLHLTLDWGDGTSISITYNNGVGPDQYPSPDVNPMNVMVSREHLYSAGGTYTVVLTVEDDDGESVSLSLVVTL